MPSQDETRLRQKAITDSPSYRVCYDIFDAQTAATCATSGVTNFKNVSSGCGSE